MQSLALLVCLLTCSLFPLAAQTPAPPLTFEIPAETAPPGANVQLKLFLTSPTPLSTTQVQLSLDPALFAPIAGVDAFSARSDLSGYADIQGYTADIHISSEGSGRIRNLPLVVVSTRLLSSASPGRLIPVNMTVTAGGASYPVSGAITVGDHLTVQRISPNANIIKSAQSTLTLTGTNFSPATTVSIAGVSISQVHAVTGQQITLTLDHAADLRGRQIHVQNPDGQSADFYPPIEPVYQQRPTSGEYANFQPILPSALGNHLLFQYVGPQSNGQDTVAYENPSDAPITLSTRSYAVRSPNASTETSITIEPGQTYITDPLPQVAGWEYDVAASAPLRIWSIRTMGHAPNVTSIVTGASVGLPPAAPLCADTPVATLQDLYSGSLEFDWSPGDPTPLTGQIIEQISGSPGPRTFTLTTISIPDQPWLTLSATSGLAPATIPFTVRPENLPPGDYVTLIQTNSACPYAAPRLSAVTLHVHASPILRTTTTSVSLHAPAPGAPGDSAVVPILGGPQTFAASAPEAPWLSLSATSGTAPTNLTLSANTNRLPPGTYNTQVVIEGRENTLLIPVSLEVKASNGASATATVVVVQATVGTELPIRQQAPLEVSLAAAQALMGRQLGVQIDNGGKWLSVIVPITPGVPSAEVIANPAGLPVGQYTGTIAVTDLVSIRVIFDILPANTPPVLLSPANLIRIHRYGEDYTAYDDKSITTVRISTGNVSLPCTIVTAAGGSAPSLEFLSGSNATTPFTAKFDYGYRNVTPGIYRSTYQVQCGTSSALLTVTDIVLPRVLTLTSPQPGLLVNAASQTLGPLSPGEIVTLYGFNIGTPTTANVTLTPAGKVSTELQTSRVFFDGVPAPILYASPQQVNLVVPYEVAGKSFTRITAGYTAYTVDLGDYAVANTSPGLFTLNGAGTGPAAALNQNNQVNSAANPAVRGTAIQLFATGEGVYTPTPATGSVTTSATPAPREPIAVTIGGQPAIVIYAGAAPGAVAGLLQINVLIPANAATGPAVPVIVRAGNTPSTTAATVAIQ